MESHIFQLLEGLFLLSLMRQEHRNNSKFAKCTYKFNDYTSQLKLCSSYNTIDTPIYLSIMQRNWHNFAGPWVIAVFALF